MPTAFKRPVLDDADAAPVATALQRCLIDLVDLALVGKQAHWNVVGERFRSVHLELDEIIDATRVLSDEVAERLVTLGVPADGRAATVAANSTLDPYPETLVQTSDTVGHVADRLKAAIATLRAGIKAVADHDPITEDLLIGGAAGLEKHLWMLQAQEL